MRFRTSLYFSEFIIPATCTRLPGTVVVKYSQNTFMGDALLFTNDVQFLEGQLGSPIQVSVHLDKEMGFISNHNTFTSRSCIC